MLEKRTDDFERDGIFRQVSYPFRIGKNSFSETALEAIAKPMAAMTVFGFIPLALLLFGVHFVPATWQNTYALLMAAGVIASVPVSWTFRYESIYHINKELFENNISLMGYRFRFWEWPKALFTGITYGRKGLTRGVTNVVRLNSKVDGYLVDCFLYAYHTDEAKEFARKLSQASGLPVIGEEFTGSQHDLNDLRHHAWLAARYGKVNPSNAVNER